MVLALVMAGSAMLIFDVVLSRDAGRAVGIGSLVLLFVSWWLVPRLIARRARD